MNATIAKPTILGTTIVAVFLFTGCTLNYTGETRGFSYKKGIVSFDCRHTPAKTVVTFDKDAIEAISKLLKQDGGAALLSKGMSPDMSEAKSLVALCQQLIRGKDINQNTYPPSTSQ